MASSELFFVDVIQPVDRRLYSRQCVFQSLPTRLNRSQTNASFSLVVFLLYNGMQQFALVQIVATPGLFESYVVLCYFCPKSFSSFRLQMMDLEDFTVYPFRNAHALGV